MDYVEPEAAPETIETDIGAAAPVADEQDAGKDDLADRELADPELADRELADRELADTDVRDAGTTDSEETEAALADGDEFDDDDVADAEFADAELADGGDTRPQELWTGLVTTVGLGIAVVQAVFILFTLAQGLSLRRTGSGSFNGDILHRLGIAFSRSIGIGQGLALVVAVVLVSLPALAGQPTASRYERRRVLTLYIVAVVAVIIGAGIAIGVRAELHLDRIQQQATTPFRRWALATDVVSTLGTALVAFLAALAALPERGVRRQEPRS